MAVQALLVALGRGATVVKPVLNYTFTADTSVGNLSTWFNSNVGGYLGASGYSVINVTINSGVNIGNSPGSGSGLLIAGFGADCTINITNNGTIWGPGGNGGDASAGSYASAGGPGGISLNVTSGQGPINVTNNGTINGGSGGGGAGIGNYSYCTSADPKYGSCGAYATAYTAAGGGGGRGYQGGSGGNASGANLGENTSGSAGSTTAGGSGGSRTNATGGSGGSTLASSGSAGSGNQASGGGGSAGNAVSGNAYITWLATGTRNGTIA